MIKDMTNIELLAKAQQVRLEYLQSNLITSDNDYIKDFIKGCISELNHQIVLLNVVIEQEVVNAQ